MESRPDIHHCNHTHNDHTLTTATLHFQAVIITVSRSLSTLLFRGNYRHSSSNVSIVDKITELSLDVKNIAEANLLLKSLKLRY